MLLCRPALGRIWWKTLLLLSHVITWRSWRKGTNDLYHFPFPGGYRENMTDARRATKLALVIPNSRGVMSYSKVRVKVESQTKIALENPINLPKITPHVILCIQPFGQFLYLLAKAALGPLIYSFISFSGALAKPSSTFLATCRQATLSLRLVRNHVKWPTC